jgi:hypothetical protein
MPDVGGVTVGSNLGNSTSGEAGPNDLIVPNLGDTFETQVNTALTDPTATVGAAAGIAGGAGSAIAAGVGVVFSTVGTFLVDFVTGLISSIGNFKNTHLLALFVGLVVVVVMFH